MQRKQEPETQREPIQQRGARQTVPSNKLIRLLKKQLLNKNVMTRFK